MTRKWLGDLDSDNEVVEKGTYTVEVTDARSSETSSGGSMLWLDLQILGGPDANRIISVGVNLPREGEKGLNFAKKKLRGFSPKVAAAGVMSLPDEDQPDALAAAVIGTRVEADLSRQGGTGPYAGNQQLDETRQINNVAPAARPVAVQTETVVNAGNEPPTDPPF